MQQMTLNPVSPSRVIMYEIALSKLESEFPNFSELEFIQAMRNRSKTLVMGMNNQIRREEVNYASKNLVD